MWRGFLSSCKYSLSCRSDNWRPNQVFHQNRNGIRTISHPMKKNKKRLRVDMRGLAAGVADSVPGDEACGGDSGRADILGPPKLTKKMAERFPTPPRRLLPRLLAQNKAPLRMARAAAFPPFFPRRSIHPLRAAGRRRACRVRSIQIVPRT